MDSKGELVEGPLGDESDERSLPDPSGPPAPADPSLLEEFKGTSRNSLGGRLAVVTVLVAGVGLWFITSLICTPVQGATVSAQLKWEQRKQEIAEAACEIEPESVPIREQLVARE